MSTITVLLPTTTIALAAGDNNVGNVDIVTVPAPLSTTGGGTEATALRVTLATDSTGVLSVDDNGGSLTVDGTVNVGNSVAVTGTFWQATQPVSAASLPLPTGAATESTLSTLNGKVPAQGQALMAASSPVVIASNQSSIPVSDGGGSLTVDGTVAVSGSVAVTGTFWQATQPVSVAAAVAVTDNSGSLTVDDGGTSLTVDGTVAATQSGTWTINSITSSVTVIDGGGTLSVDDAGASLTVDAAVNAPVYVRLSDGASPISTLPVSLASLPVLPAGGNTIGGVDVVSAAEPTPLTGSGTLTGATQAVTLTLAGRANAAFQLTGTWVGTITFEGSVDSSNWQSVFAVKDDTGVAASTATANGIYRVGCAGYTNVRARCSSYTSGSIVIDARATGSSSSITMIGAIPAGDNNIGNVDIATLPAPLNVTGSGAGASALRVVLADDWAGSLGVTLDNRVNADDWVAVRLTSGSGFITSLSTTGGGTEASALRVTLASDSTGVLSVDDNGGSLTVDGTVAATQSGTWNVTNISGTVSLPTGAATEATLSTLNGKVPAQGQALMAASVPVTIASNQSAVAVSDGGSSLTVDGTVAVSGTVAVTDNSGSLTVDDGGSSLTVDGTVAVSSLPALAAGANNIGDVDVLTVPAPLSTTGNGTAATALRVTMASDSTGTIAATQSGTWNVGTVTTITNAVTVQDGGGSITVDGTVAVSGSVAVTGTFWQATQPVSLASVPSHAVTNAGTFAVQVDGSALTALQLMDDVVYTDDAAFTAGSGKIAMAGLQAVAHGSAPDAADAGDAVVALANRHRIPFVMGGHPNIVTTTAYISDATGAQTDASIVGTIASGTKVVVTRITVTVDQATTAATAVKLGFGATSIPADSATGAAGILFDHKGIPPGSGATVGDGSGILGVGADGEELRLTCEDPAGGALSVSVSYYTIES